MKPPEVIVIGTSLGGLDALERLLGALPRAFPAPVAIVQHRASEPDSGMVELLQRRTALPVCEAEDKQPIVSSRVYVAPADYHLLVDEGHFALSTDARVCHARPAIDPLFESAADSYRDRVLAVLLTGASSDGAKGVVRVKERGGLVVAQDPATAEAPTMPTAAIATGSVDRVLSIDDIARFLQIMVQDPR